MATNTDTPRSPEADQPTAPPVRRSTPRPLGSLRGRVRIGEDFDAPLPEEAPPARAGA